MFEFKIFLKSSDIPSITINAKLHETISAKLPILKVALIPNIPTSIKITLPKTKNLSGNLASILRTLKKTGVIYNRKFNIFREGI